MSPVARKLAVAGLVLFLGSCVSIGAASADVGEINSVVRQALIHYGLIDASGSPISGGWTGTATSDLNMSSTYNINNAVDVSAMGLALPTTATLNADETVTAHSRFSGRFSNEGASGGFDTVDVNTGNVQNTNRISVRCVSTQGIKFRVPTGQTIQTPAGTTASGGYLYSNRIGSYVTIERKDSTTTWVSTEIAGTWSVDSTTSAGFAYTPTAWVSYTPTIGGWTSGVGTAAGKYRQSGNVLDVQIMLPATGAVTGAGAQPTFDLPSGFSGDTASEPSGSTLAALGVAEFYDQSAGLIYGGIVYPTDADTVKCAIASTGASPTSTTPMTWANLDQLSLRFSRPVQ